MKGAYIGVGSVRTLSQCYVGSGGVRKVKDIFIGINGAVKKVWSATVPAGQVVLTSSQVWTVPEGVKSIDVFCVGGGGGGSFAECLYYDYKHFRDLGGIGGCGGCTSYQKKLTVTPGQQLPVTIGAGGLGAKSYYYTFPEKTYGSYTVYDGYKGCKGQPGNQTSVASICSADGGAGGTDDSRDAYRKGGSGGGQPSREENRNNLYYNEIYRASQGGEDGTTKMVQYSTTNKMSELITVSKGDHIAQGTTTRAFGETDGNLYSGGGGGGFASSSAQSIYNAIGEVTTGGAGGAGGGGHGGYLIPRSGSFSVEEQYHIPAVPGVANTGGGGGGGINVQRLGAGSTSRVSLTKDIGADGGSGVVIIRWPEQ